jgi:prevent-host-death family protein
VGVGAYTDHVRVEVGVRELRENLAEWLDRAAAGEEILVTERGQPKAVLRSPDSAYERLIREGKVTPRRGSGPRTLPRQVELDGDGPTLTDYLMWSRGKIPWPGPGPEPGAEGDSS